MLSDIIEDIDTEQFNSIHLSILLIHIHENKIKTTTQLLNDLMQKYLEMNNDHGHLYCISHPWYKNDGENVYKLGRATDMNKRLNGYTTCYIKPVTVEHLSLLIPHYDIAEYLLFHKLRHYRMAQNREFFDCELNIIKRTIDETVQEFKTMRIIDIMNKYNINITKFTNIKQRFIGIINHFDQLNKIIKNDIIEDVHKPKIKDILMIEDLLIANNEISNCDNTDKLYNDIIIKMNSSFITIHETNILSLKNIIDTFNLKFLDKSFLTDLHRLSNVMRFEYSLIYFANDKYKIEFTNDHKKEFDYLTNVIFKQRDKIQELTKLFWPDGLLSNTKIKVYSDENTFTEEQNIFITHNKVNDWCESRTLFHSLKTPVPPKSAYGLIKWLEFMIIEFFGGFINFDSKRNTVGKSRKNVKKPRKEPVRPQRTFHDMSINATRYMELVSNKDRNILINLPEHIMKASCQYKTLHNMISINKFYPKDEKLIPNHEPANTLPLSPVP